MESSNVYRIVPVPSGKWRRTLEPKKTHSRRKTTFEGILHQSSPIHPRCQTTLSNTITLASSHQEPTLSLTCGKATQARQHHKSTLADHDCSPNLPGNQHLRSGPTSVPYTKVSWRWLHLILVLTLSKTSLGQRTSWVYQSHTPFTVQKNFQKFVEEAGGDSRNFRFLGNFFDSDEHTNKNDQFVENPFLDAPFKNDGNEGKPFIKDFPFMVPIKSAVGDFPSIDSIQHIKEDFPPVRTHTKHTVHESLEVKRVPKSFYEDIFDRSLPVDSPYRTSFLPSPHPGNFRFRNDNKRQRTNRKLESPEKGYQTTLHTPFFHSGNSRTRDNRKLENTEKVFLSKSYQPFSSDLLTPLPFQKPANIQGFSSQTLGNIKFSKRRSKIDFDNFSQFSSSDGKDLGRFGDEIRSTEKDVTRIGLILKRDHFNDSPGRPPRKLSLDKFKLESLEDQNIFLNHANNTQQEPPSVSSSLNKPPSLASQHKQRRPWSQHKPPRPSPPKPKPGSPPSSSQFGQPNFKAIISAYEANEGARFGGPPGPPGHSHPWGSHWTLERPPSGGGRKEKAVTGLTPEVAEGVSGCPSVDGVLYGAGAVWYETGCKRHTCIHFRGRHFVETDSCDSEIHNTSYRCLVLVDIDASYPHCCPTYQCHPDNLGRPDS